MFFGMAVNEMNKMEVNKMDRMLKSELAELLEELPS